MKPQCPRKTVGGWILPIKQLRVSRCIVDEAFALEFHDNEEVYVVRIESPFTISEPGSSCRLDPSAHSKLGHAIALFGQIVRAAKASSEGRLEISFQNNQVLTVEPHAAFESWESHGSNGMRLVCNPGGNISVWYSLDSGHTQPATAPPSSQPNDGDDTR